MNTDERIGAALKAARIGASITQQGMADTMRIFGHDWTQPAVAKIELGKRPIRLSEAVALHTAFHFSLEMLTGITSFDAYTEGRAAGFADAIRAIHVVASGKDLDERS